MTSKQSSALLIGADPYPILACLEAGIKPVVVYAPGLNDWGYIQLPSEVEAVFAEDTSSIESVLCSLQRAGLTNGEFSYIYTSDEMALLTAATIARVLDIPSALTPDVAIRFRDKWLQKNIVANAGIEVAMSQVIEDIYTLNPEEIANFDKAVLKPIMGAGTHKTSLTEGRRELIDICAEYRQAGISQRTFVLEEFIAGSEWVVDGVVFDGELQFFSVRSYTEPCLSAVSSNAAVQAEVFDPVTDSDIYKRVRPVVEGALRSLGLSSGVFHMELFYQEQTGKLVFGECAARAGGGLTHEVMKFKFGVDLSLAAARCAMGINPRIDPSVRSEVVGTTFLSNRPGVLISYPSPEEIGGLPGVEHFRLELPYGFRMVDILAGTTEGVGQVMLSGGTRDEFRSRRSFVTQWFDERLVVVPAQATNQDLRKWQNAHWPESVSFFQPYSSS
ncbi:acetyl-CoA carboxylase biotin carboxylase subunit family protein [Streptomyces sp. NPDC048639]|uniref:ATP-grasp domain-containing protein n=1 Tax=Streptomyces sp. NPDC048639 TaxID=3365581 RepID=UPI0037167162